MKNTLLKMIGVGIFSICISPFALAQYYECGFTPKSPLTTRDQAISATVEDAVNYSNQEGIGACTGSANAGPSYSGNFGIVVTVTCYNNGKPSILKYASTCQLMKGSFLP